MFRVIAWSGTVLLGSLLVDGCGKIESPSLPGLPEPTRDAGPASRDDAGSAPSGEATAGFVCPAPEPGYEPGEGWWGRDLDTGHCCAYSDSGAIPRSMAAFRTEEDCLNDCRCNTVDRLVERGATLLEAERATLECECQDGTCPEDLAEVTRRLCDSPFAENVTRREGCGMIAVGYWTTYAGREHTFDAETGELLGTDSFTDSLREPCLTPRTRAGRTFRCSDTTTCNPCDLPMSSPVPACE